MVRRRSVSTGWWAIGVAAYAALLALAYPTVRGNSALDKTFAGLPAGVQAALGLAPGSSLTAPIGYLNSQYFANILPAVYLIFAICLAAWSVAGDESTGTLELLLANPVSRIRVAFERAVGLSLLLGALTAASIIAMVVLAPPFRLTHGLGLWNIAAATVAGALSALTFASLAFLVAAQPGREPGAWSAPARAAWPIASNSEAATCSAMSHSPMPTQSCCRTCCTTGTSLNAATASAAARGPFPHGDGGCSTTASSTIPSMAP